MCWERYSANNISRLLLIFVEYSQNKGREIEYCSCAEKKGHHSKTPRTKPTAIRLNNETEEPRPKTIRNNKTKV